MLKLEMILLIFSNKTHLPCLYPAVINMWDVGRSGDRKVEHCSRQSSPAIPRVYNREYRHDKCVLLLF